MTGNDMFVSHKSKGSRGMGAPSGKDLKAKAAARMEEAAAQRGAAAQHEAHQWMKHRGDALPPYMTRKQMDKMLAQQANGKTDPLTMLLVWTMMSRR